MGGALCDDPPGALVCVGVCVFSCLGAWESGRAPVHALPEVAVTCLRVCLCV